MSGGDCEWDELPNGANGTQLLPRRVIAGRDRRRARAARRRHLKGLAHERRHNVDHRVVGRLARVRVAFGRVANDAERGLVERATGGSGEARDQVNRKQGCTNKE